MHWSMLGSFRHPLARRFWPSIARAVSLARTFRLGELPALVARLDVTLSPPNGGCENEPNRSTAKAAPAVNYCQRRSDGR